MNLVEVIRMINANLNKLERERENEINKINEKYKKVENDLKIALQVNMDLNTICTECGGQKTISCYINATDTDYKTCDRCNGTGMEPKF
jgi:DnaJ-class molecular chaperone